MRTVDLERVIRAPIDQVFDWLGDATNYQRSPFIRRVTLVRPGDVSEHGVGAVRLVVTPLMRVTVRVVEYDPPHLMRYKMLNSVPPLRRQDGCLSFATVQDGTLVHWESQTELALPFFADAWTATFIPLVVMGITSLLLTADRELRRS